MTRTEISKLLRQVLQQGSARPEAIRKFQHEILHGAGPGELTPEEWDVLCDLVWDLDFYVEDPSFRVQDASYYGPERLQAEIQEACRRLGLAYPLLAIKRG